MKCAYCGDEITGPDLVQYDGLSFCNTIHRYSYKTSQQTAAADKETQSAAPAASALNTVWTIIGSGFGLALGLYAGVYVFVPFILIVGVLWILNRTNTVSTEGRSILALLSAQFGWMFVGALLTGQWELVYIDLIFIGIGIVWLMFRVHAIPIIILMLFQLGVLILNINLILAAEIGAETHRALTVHIVLRIMVLFALGNGLRVIRKRSMS
jgi:hypothetical protein